MSRFTELGYIVIGSAKVPQWRDFAAHVLGLCPVDRQEGLWLRMDEWAQRIVILPDQRERLMALGWAVRTIDDLRAVQSAVASTGTATIWGSPAQCEARGVQEFVTFKDPAGNDHEVFWGRTQAGTPFISPAGVRRFVAGKLGLGHVVLMAGQDLELIREFWHAVGELQLTDFIDRPASEPDERRLTFFYRCGPRHHSVGYGNGKVPSYGCHHFLIEVGDMDDVGKALDRAVSRQITVACSIGRHSNDEMTSIYIETPSGFLVEYGYGGLLVGEDHEVANFAQSNIWGHHWQEGWLARWSQEQALRE